MFEAGRTLHARVPRRSHGQWTAPSGRPDPLGILARSNANRLPELVPVRNGRMMASPFAFYRGSPAVMAANIEPGTVHRYPLRDLRRRSSQLRHLRHAERNQVFDLNDFDETQPGPWEWDLKRLAASLVIAAGRPGSPMPPAGRRCWVVRRGSRERWRRWRSSPRSRCGTPGWTSRWMNPPHASSRPVPEPYRPWPRPASEPACRPCRSSQPYATAAG